MKILVMIFSIQILASTAMADVQCKPQVITGPCSSNNSSEITVVACDGSITQSRISCQPAVSYLCHDNCTMSYSEQDLYYMLQEVRGSDRYVTNNQDGRYFGRGESAQAACRKALSEDPRCNGSCK